MGAGGGVIGSAAGGGALGSGMFTHICRLPTDSLTQVYTVAPVQRMTLTLCRVPVETRPFFHVTRTGPSTPSPSTYSYGRDG